METPLHPHRNDGSSVLAQPRDEPFIKASEPGLPARGIWAIAGDRLELVEYWDVGPAIVLVPNEQILILAVDLPLPSLAKRAAALPFAVEDALGQPLDIVHTALGEELSPRRHLAAVVENGLMLEWIALLNEAGLERAALVPDALRLPVPEAGEWSVQIASTRACVRRDEGTGFAAPAGDLAALWRLAGRPGLVVFGEPLPPDLAAEPGHREGALLDIPATPLLKPAIDLRQGIYARPSRRLSSVWRRVALVAAAGLASHAVVALADTLALGHIAHVHRDRLAAMIEQAAPGTVVGDDPSATVADLFPADGSATSGFLPLLARSSAALRSLPQPPAVTSLDYDEGTRSLTLEVEGGDLPALQRAQGALAGAGLDAESGAANVEDGRATGKIVIRSSAGGAG